MVTDPVNVELVMFICDDDGTNPTMPPAKRWLASPSRLAVMLPGACMLSSDRVLPSVRRPTSMPPSEIVASRSPAMISILRIEVSPVVVANMPPCPDVVAAAVEMSIVWPLPSIVPLKSVM